MEKQDSIAAKIRELTDGYIGPEGLDHRLGYLEAVLQAYRRYLPARVADKIKIDPRAKRIEGERRQITVAFADLSGFTALSETMDAEDIAQVINEFFSRMVAVVFKYGGSVDKFLGDALMVLFGAPVAHHDDPERAVRAGLEMQAEMARFNQEKALGHPLAMSIGINTGPAVALNVGSEERMEYTVIGDTVNLAARLEGVSGPGEIIISQFTYEKIADIADVEKRPSVRVKGKRRPVINYRVKGIHEHHRLPEMSRLAVVGRERELHAIEDALAAAARGLRLLGIVGSAGVGKTRLGLFAEQEARNKGFTVVSARCTPYETNTPYLVFSQALGALCQLKKDASEEEKKLLLGIRLKNLGLVLGETLPYLGALFGIAFAEVDQLPPEELKRRIFTAVGQLLARTTAGQPVLFRIEDLQWADPTSQELLNHLVKELANVPLLFLCEYRSDYAFPWLGHPQTSVIILENLDRKNTGRLLGAVLEVTAVAEEVAGLVYEKSQGNPLFLTEIAKTLLRTGSVRRTADTAVPTARFRKLDIASSVSSVILDQVDRMSEMDRHLLQYAAVIGTSFKPGLLGRIARMPGDLLQGHLERLEHFEGILVSRPEQGSYEFLAPTTYEVVYGSLLKKRRRELHTLIAGEIEGEAGEDLGPVLETLAYHYARSDNVAKGIHYLKAAADKSYRIYALAETLRFFDGALELMGGKTLAPEFHQDRLEVLRRRGVILRHMGRQPEALVNQKRSLKLARALNSPLDEAGAALNIGIIYQEMGVPKKGLSYWRRARRIFKKTGDKNSQALAVNNLGNYWLNTGDLDRAIECFNEVRLLSRETNDQRGLALSHLNIGLAQERKHDFMQALESYAQALKLFETMDDRKNTARVLNMIGLGQLSLGNLAEAEQKLQAAEKLASEIGDKITQCSALANIGLLHAQAWRLEPAYEKFSAALAIAQVTGDKATVMNMGNNIGDVHLYRGDLGQATKLHERSLELAREIQDPFSEATILRGLGWDHFYQANFRRAREHFEQSRALFERIGDRRSMTVSQLGSGFVAAHVGGTPDVIAMASGVAQKAREINDPELLALSLDLMLDHALAGGDLAPAQALGQELLGLCRQINNKRLYAWTLARAARVALGQGQREQSRAMAEKAGALAADLGDQILMAYNGLSRSREALATKDMSSALTHVAQAIEHARKTQAREHLLLALHQARQIRTELGHQQDAQAYATEYERLWNELVAPFSAEERQVYRTRLGIPA